MAKINKKKFKKALKGSAGIITLVAQRLECSRKCVYEYIEKHKLANLLKDERERLVDMAESNLVKKIQQEDWKATEKVLNTLGKNRGYAEKHEIEHSTKDDKPIKINIVMPENKDK